MGVPGSADLMLIGQRGYQISRSLRFNSADSAYLNRTPASAGSLTTWTWSGWLKRGNASTYQRLFGTGDNNSVTNQTSIGFDTNRLSFYNVNGGSKTTTAVLRDHSAWYHFVVVWDSNNATAADRIRIYINNQRQTTFDSSTDPSSGTNTVVNSTAEHRIGTLPVNAGSYFDGYLTEINFIDGQALTPSSFGETDTITGVWKPKRYTGTYGTNGFYLNFSDNSGTTSTTLGKDSSGNGNHFTPNNFSVTAGAGNDSMIDTPTPYADGGNGRGNYCTLNPLDNPNTTYAFAQDGNLLANLGTGVGTFLAGTHSTLGGKYYWEFTPSIVGNGLGLGITYGSTTTTDANSKAIFYALTGTKRILGGADTAYGASYTNNDVIGVAVNSISGTIEFFKNGTSQGVITDSSISLQPYRPFVFNNSSSANSNTTCNFGQRAFAYTPPSGFLALNTQNLPDPTIKKPGTYMDVVTYTGNGSTQSISSLNFSPDFVWIKNRSGAYDHILVNSVVGANITLFSNRTSSEITNNNGGYVSALGSNGFTVTAGATTSTDTNQTGSTYVAWCWDESATPGFDIVTFTSDGVTTGGTFAHTLGVAPKMVIYKGRNTTDNWYVYHADVGPNSALFLNLTSASTATGIFNNTAPTSSVIQLKQSSWGAGNLVAYCFSEVAGFSKFGSYTGNGSSDGPFVYLGFRPRWVMAKATAGAEDWVMLDAARNTYNVMNERLYADTSTIPSPADLVDFTATGFKIRNNGTNDLNTSGRTYIFAAFAETPAKYSLAR